jgi:resuscitation-promoting factor RpfB
MRLTEPAVSPDDTQPNDVLSSTQPMRALRLKRPPRWLVGTLLVVISMTLTLTILLLFNAQDAAPARPTITVALLMGGETRSLTTAATTVADLLVEQGILLAPEDTIVPAPETPLSPDMTIIIDKARSVTLSVNDERQTLATTFINPVDILRQANITLNEADKIWIDGTEAAQTDLMLWAIPPLDITIRRAIPVTIMDGTTEYTLTTAANTIGEALFEAGISLYLADTVIPDAGEPLTASTHIVITRAQTVSIAADSTTIETRLAGGTVADALAQSGVSLMGLDYVIPADDTPLTPGLVIQVIRVTENILTEDESLPYETVYQADANMELDTRAVAQTGKNGIRRHHIRVRYEDGVEIAREPDGSEIVEQPVNHVIAYGTRIVLRTIDTPEGPREYWRKLHVYATSYKPEALGGDDSTALGMKLEKGMIAADPKLIPWRTNLYVPEYGLGIMGDTGGPRRSRYWIDLGYSDHDYTSWHWLTDVYLLTPVPDEINFLLPEWSKP